MMKEQVEQLHFTYKSIGNFCRLLATIQYEKSHTPREITVFHQRFDRNECDELIEQFLTELFPSGATIGEDELIKLNSHIERFMQKDKETQDLFVKYDKRHYSSYVYFKPDNVVIPAEMGQHNTIVKDICIDYFKDFQTVDLEYLKKFIKDNFEISSDYTTVGMVIADAPYIKRYIEIIKRRSVSQ